ncbi:Global transcription regulator sge1 [Glugoides intestinalis]
MRSLTGYINTYEEAILVMHAIRLGCFMPLTERLRPEDKSKIESGDIFCFVENKNGMKRWTDGKIWSPSKICGEFLVYQEVPKDLSKNSIKKRKFNDKLYITESIRREDIIDRTTLHKKAISIRFKKTTYHIISYYRPIFANYSLISMPFFQQLSDALTLFPILNEDSFVKEHMQNDSDFYKKFNIQKDFQRTIMEDSRRNVLEKIAAEVLGLMWKKMQNVKK